MLFTLIYCFFGLSWGSPLFFFEKYLYLANNWARFGGLLLDEYEDLAPL
jgi:hypothetical protein